MSKLMPLDQAVELIKENDMVAFGGNTLHRAPMAAVREIARQEKKGLRLVKTAGAMDIDLLCLADSVSSVDAGFISYETGFGLATFYRKAVEGGRIKANEHACYTVISALRAAQAGIPFMPVRGLKAGDLLKVADYFKVISDPFSGEDITVVKALAPDVAIIHVQKADSEGNTCINGPKYEDVLLSRAAKKVIITAEAIQPSVRSQGGPENVDIPGFLVSAVVHVPAGASPCSCAGFYDIDIKNIKAFRELKDKDGLTAYLESFENKDRRKTKAGGF